MIYSGNISKMLCIEDKPLRYFLNIGNSNIEMNSLIGSRLEISFDDRINCINCNNITKKSFHQGYCYSCFISLPQCDLGVLFPEKDLAHLGISRDMKWAKKNSLVDHFVYLAITSGLKVGVTRSSQLHTRWIDQGAIKAIKFAKTPNRHLAGLMEVKLKKYVSDKTNYKKMLCLEDTDFDLVKSKLSLIENLNNKEQKFILFDDTITNLYYPYNYSLLDFKSISLDKEKSLSGKLIGIKGQYLIFDNNKIINIRKHNGYYINLNINN